MRQRTGKRRVLVMQPLSRLQGHAAGRILGKQARSATQARAQYPRRPDAYASSATPAAFLAAGKRPAWRDSPARVSFCNGVRALSPHHRATGEKVIAP